MHIKRLLRLLSLPLLLMILLAAVSFYSSPAMADSNGVAHTNGAAISNGVALTPPMGWNSWNHFGCNVSEATIKQQADAMVSSGMKAAGYQYINIDDCWATGRDGNGTIIADTSRFPDGMQALANYVHNDGLKLGIYTDAGTSTCAGRPGSYGHEQQDANTYASWGIDYVKEDWCNTSGLDPQTQYSIMRDALHNTGRPIVLSICNWGVNSPWNWGPTTGNLWRTTGDIQDNWGSMLGNLDSSSQHASSAGPGAWNDPDMLEVGNGGMTDTEYRSHLTLWAEMASPLIAGNDLTNMSGATISTLTNPEVLAVDQDAAGVQGTVVADNGSGLQVWSKRLNDGSRAVVLFNRSGSSANITANWSNIGLAAGSASVRDLWARTDLGSFSNSYTAYVPSHGVVMLKIAGTNGSGACNGFTGYYKIVNRNSGKNLDVQSDSTADLATIVQYTDNGQADQQWSFQDAGGGYCKIVNRNSGKLINIPGPTTTSNTQLIQYLDDGNSNSQWALNAVGGGYYTIASRYDNQNVDVGGGSTADNAAVIQWPNNGGYNQEWYFVAV